MTALVVVLAVVIAVLTVLVVGLLRSHADILRALHTLGIDEAELRGDAADSHDHSHGAAAPQPQFQTRDGVAEPRDNVGDPRVFDLTGATPTGAAKRVAVNNTRHATLLAFLSSGCLTCRDFWQSLSDDITLPGNDTRLVIITQGAEAESPSAVQALAPPNTTVIMSSQAWLDYDIPVSPYFLLVDGPSSAVIGEGAAQNWETVVGLLNQALADTGRSSSGTPTARTRARGAEREADTDQVLADAGIEPGDPRLFHEPRPDTR